MKLYICEDYRIAKWRRHIINDKKISLVFAKKCICDFLNEKENAVDIIFSKNEYGKPYIDGIYKIIETGKNEPEKIKIDISLFFSLSHSESMIVCAVACFNIGADCQKININNIETCKKIAGRFYTEKENIFLNSINSGDSETEQEYINNFFKIWAKKEAYIKYTGRGLSEGMNTFSVTDEKSQSNYHADVYFRNISLEKSKKIKIPNKDKFYIYLCYNKENKNNCQIKYFN